MVRVPNVAPHLDADPIPEEVPPSTLPQTGGEPRPRKAHAPDDPAMADLNKPGADADLLPGPPLGQFGSF